MPQPGSESGYGIMFAGKGITCKYHHPKTRKEKTQRKRNMTRTKMQRMENQRTKTNSIFISKINYVNGKHKRYFI